MVINVRFENWIGIGKIKLKLGKIKLNGGKNPQGIGKFGGKERKWETINSLLMVINVWFENLVEIRQN